MKNDVTAKTADPNLTGLKALLILMRPYQWIKNGFVFVGALFSYKVLTTLDIQHALCAFAAFCCASSAVYVMNDLKDAAADRCHPRKRLRPIAAGQVSPTAALSLGIVLGAVAIMVGMAVSIKVMAFVLGYFFINLAYSFWLKHEAISDVFCIFSGFMMRLLAGTAGIGIPPSRWLLMTGMMITLFLGFGKRRAELAAAYGGGARRSLEQYSLPLLDSLMAVCAAGTLITYGLYTLDSNTVALHQTDNLIWTMPIVSFGMFRYLYLIHQYGKGQDTSIDLIKDPFMLLTVGCWASAVVAITWF